MGFGFSSSSRVFQIGQEKVQQVSREKTISLAEADFKTVLRLARRFDFVKVMSGTRLVGVFASGRRWNKTGWLAEIEPLPPGTMERIYARQGSGEEGHYWPHSMRPRKPRRGDKRAAYLDWKHGSGAGQPHPAAENPLRMTEKELRKRIEATRTKHPGLTLEEMRAAIREGRK